MCKSRYAKIQERIQRKISCSQIFHLIDSQRDEEKLDDDINENAHKKVQLVSIITTKINNIEKETNILHENKMNVEMRKRANSPPIYKNGKQNSNFCILQIVPRTSEMSNIKKSNSLRNGI